MSLTTIHDVGAALQAYLRVQGCPLDVVDGPEGTRTTTAGRERIVIEHDSGQASFDGPRGLHLNARHAYTAIDPYKITIYARSARSGALQFEHRSRALLVREVVLAGLRYVSAVNKNRFLPKSGAFTDVGDLVKSEANGGAVYEMTVTYELPIRVVTFAGEAQPEGALSNMTSRTKVSRTGAADDDNNPNTPPLTSETACGA
jgi:hypothetical protein